MGWQKVIRQKGRELCCACTTLKELFQITTISLLGLLLPLSFLLLARISSSHFPFILSYQPINEQASSYLLSLRYYTKPSLYGLVSVITLATLVQCLAGKITLLTDATYEPIFRPRLYIAWIFLCTLQLCVGVGIEGSTSVGVDKFSFGIKRSLLSKMIFFLGLHETMLYWCRTVVKPIADENIIGVAREERWVERVAMAMSFGFVWWWRLRDEVEAMVTVSDVKKELRMTLETVDLLNWWLYYLTVTIGMVRIVKAALWLASLFLCTSDHIHINYGEDLSEADDKV